MRRWYLLGVIFVVTALAAAAAAPVGAPAGADPPPGGIRLLQGYQHNRGQGEDTLVGRIWKDGGLEIHYDIGRLAGNVAEAQEKKPGHIWAKGQVVGDRRVTIVKAKDGRVFVSFASEKDDNRVDYPANFNATIKNDEELADLLLITLTYAKGR